MLGTHGDDMGQDSFIRLPEVQRRTSLSRSEIYRRVQKGTFPRQRRISAKVAVWIESEVRAWMDEQLQAHLEELIG